MRSPTQSFKVTGKPISKPLPAAWVGERRVPLWRRALAAMVIPGLVGACAPTARLPVFYGAPVTSSQAAPGTLIRYEALPRPRAGGRAYRVVYQSTAADGSLIPVSGMVILPDGPAPAAGRPIVAWGHPTTGVQPRCAPSLSPLRFMMVSGLSQMLEHGFIVAATDYPGLGTGGDHPFLDGPSEGRAVLDIVRAVAGLPDASPSPRFALWGHSQGGQAVLFAASMARSYAPELKLAGVAAAAPATDLAALFRADLGTNGGNNLTALTLWSWARVYQAPYDGIIEPQAQAAIQTVADKCIDTLVESPAKRSADKVLATGFLTVPDVTAVEPWRSLIARNSAPVLPADIPVFLSQGSADVIVRPEVTRAYMARLCAGGVNVTWDPMPDVGHGWIAAKSAKTALAWINDRLNGAPAANDCALIPARSGAGRP